MHSPVLCLPALFLTFCSPSAHIAVAAVGGWQPLNEPGCGGWVTSLTVSPHDGRRVLVGGDLLGIGVSTDRGDHWTYGTGLKSWEIADITFHPTNANVVWAGTLSGPYRSRDGGQTWQEMRQGFPETSSHHYSAPVEVVLFDPNNSRRMLAFGGSSRRMHCPANPLWGVVWESRDGGENWLRRTTLTADGSNDGEAPGRNIVGAAFAARSSKTVYAAVDHAGVLVSRDGGKTFAPSNRGLPHTNIVRVVAHPTQPDTLWVSLSAGRTSDDSPYLPGGVFKSVDGGRSWQGINRGLPQQGNENPNFTPQFKGFAVAPSAPDVMVAADSAWNGTVIYRTSNGGQSWRAVAKKGAEPGSGLTNVETAYPVGCAATVVRFDPRDADVVFAAGSEYVLRSTDGGRTWADATSRPVGRSDKAAGMTGQWCGRGYSGLCSINFRFDPFRPGRSFILGMDASKGWESTDALRSWTYRGTVPGPWGGSSDAAFARDGHVYITTGQFGSHAGILRTRNGSQWDEVHGPEHGLPSNQGGGIATGVYTLPDDPAKVWAVVGGRLYRSTDGGDQWLATDLPSGLGWLAADPRQPTRIYVSGSQNVYVTEDGERFTAIGGPRVAGRITCDRDGRLYLAAYRGERPGLWRWAEGQWTRLRDDHYLANVAVDPGDPHRIAVCADDHPYHDHCYASGVAISADGGRTWSAFNEGLPILRGSAIAFDPFDTKQLVFGSLGSGYFKTRWPKTYRPTGDQQYAATDEDAAFAQVVKPRKIVVRNGAMTQGLSIPANWNGKYGDVQVRRDQRIFKKGPASLCVEASGGSGQAFQEFEATGGEQFTLLGWVRSSGDVEVNVAVQSFDAGFTRNQFDQVKYLQGEADWSDFRKTVTIPDWAARFNVLLLVEGTGRAWLDEVHEASTAVDEGTPVDPMTSEPPPKDKPSVPGWGFYPQFPTAWKLKHESFLARTTQGDVDVIFFGDSITQGWDDDGKAVWDKVYAPHKAVNYGIGGDTTRQVLWRLDHGEVDGLSPRLVVLMIGTNNLYDDYNSGTDDEIAKGIQVVVAKLRKKLPKAKILLLAMLPRQNDYFCNRIRAINAKTAKLDDGRTVRYLDIGDRFLASPGTVRKGLFHADELHLIEKGYETWAEAMQPRFEELLQE